MDGSEEKDSSNPSGGNPNMAAMQQHCTLKQICNSEIELFL